MGKQMDVVELFAGVGGFRHGLETADKSFFHTIWANQWEPGSKKQHAFDCYCENFPDKDTTKINRDINDVWESVPKHQLLVGGFPCQDYSVASTGAKGIEGKKGVLWWPIRNIVEKRKPKYVLLENVDRLIRSPRDNRGRDFSIMLRCFSDLDYVVEWRIINAAEYGAPQRRRRIFIFASHKSTNYSKSIINEDEKEIISNKGFFQKPFPIKPINTNMTVDMGSVDISKSKYLTVQNLSENFDENSNHRYYQSGIMKGENVFTCQVTPIIESPKTLDTILKKNVSSKYYLSDKEIEFFMTFKKKKSLLRTAKNGYKYNYAEGSMSFPDDISKPARTLLTSEGLNNRSTHVVNPDGLKKYRILTPEECEMINGFEEGWTKMLPERTRYFVMGNALVVSLITRMGKRIMEID